MTAAAILLAGGRGSRVGAGRNKVLLPLGGRPMIAWSLDVLAGTPGVGPVVVVARAEDHALVGGLLGGSDDGPGPAGVEVVTGGPTRQASELAGLRRLAARIRSGAVDVVLIHDGARPLLGSALVARVLRTAREVGGAVPGLPRDDLALAGPAAPDGVTPELVDVAPPGLVVVQTPQGFRAGPLLAAYEEADRRGFVGTDTASCLQWFAPELPIRVVPGEGRNFKVTYAEDLATAEAVLGRAGT